MKTKMLTFSAVKKEDLKLKKEEWLTNISLLIKNSIQIQAQQPQKMIKTKRKKDDNDYCNFFYNI
jgi:hypothetical protein